MKPIIIAFSLGIAGGAAIGIAFAHSVHSTNEKNVQVAHNAELSVLQSLLTDETQFHETNVAQCERAAGFAIKAIAVYDYNKSGLEAIKRVYELTASEPIAVRQGAARVTSMIEMYHRMTGNNEPNRLILEQFDKELKLACQKRPLK